MIEDRDNATVQCSACDAVIIDADGAVHVPIFIPTIAGLHRNLGTATLPDGSVVTYTEYPSICVKPECLTKLLADPRYEHMTLEQYVERRRIGLESSERLQESLDHCPGGLLLHPVGCECTACKIEL